MNITDTIDQLDTLITNGAPIHQTKPILTSLREQADALDTRVRTLEAEAKAADQTLLIASLRKHLDDANAKLKQLNDGYDVAVI